jgi:hypothetical protein
MFSSQCGGFHAAAADRPVFGLVRTMTGTSTAKKFDSEAYIRQNCEGETS